MFFEPRMISRALSAAMILLLAACDVERPLGPEMRTAAAGGPTVNAPSNLTATAASNEQIWLAWLDNSTNETGFRIERSAASSGPWTSVGTTGANVTAFGDNQPPAAEQPACYRVLAFNGSGDSHGSNVACTAMPIAPSSLVASAAGGAIDLTWTDNSGVEDGFQ